ncbi:hypothetical protein ILYODFUR_032451 [Ilyodon furcidens]|uniref:RRM domain-containing protein n=1 Tax=Ilyodon furcidens TaxID=33524 RepID=A0ABV0U0U1_9TELE
MNPLTKVKLINELNEREADLGIKEAVSWHSEYKDSAWIFVGGFPYELTEGDLICVFSQYGEIVNINLVRDKKTGKSKGFCFVCYEDQRSTILAVDNFNGIKIKGRTIRVDHVKDYRPPKDHEDIDDVTKHLREEGCAPKDSAAASHSEEPEQYAIPVKKAKKDKKEKKKKKKEKERKKKSRASSSAESSPRHPPAAIKEEKQDAAYDKYNHATGPQNGQKATERGGGQEEERWRGRDREEDKRRTSEKGDERRRRDGDDRERETERNNRDKRKDTDKGDDRKRDDRGRDSNRKKETDQDKDRRRDSDRGDGRRKEDRRDTDRDNRWRETDRDESRREKERDDGRRRDGDNRRRETDRR